MVNIDLKKCNPQREAGDGGQQVRFIITETS